MDLKNRVVVRYRNGQTLKGFTLDFTPNKETFHVADYRDERKVTEVSTKDLKAVFFVKTFEGDRLHDGAYTPESFDKVGGMKLKVTFFDNEVLYGTSNAYTPNRKGFFILPADQSGNNERVYVVSAAATGIALIQAPTAPALVRR